MLETENDSAPRVGIAPDSWGVWNPVDDVQPSPAQYLREVQEAGYHWTELGPFRYLGTDPAQLRDDFARHDLALSGGTVFTHLNRGAAEIETAWADVRKVAHVVREGARHRRSALHGRAYHRGDQRHASHVHH